jgi:hypothetical protein
MTQLSMFAATTDDFLVNSPNGFDTFVLRVNGFTVDGNPIKVPGLNTEFGLYIEGTVAVSGNPSVYGPGTIAMLLDPTNNDGSLSATFDPNSVTGAVSFSNPAGQADDITLASGQFVSGTFGPQSNGNMGLLLVNTFNPDASISRLLQGAALDIQTQLFNTDMSRVAGMTNTTPSETFVTVNDGFGVVNLTPASGSTTSDVNVPLHSLLSELEHMTFLHGSHRG